MAMPIALYLPIVIVSGPSNKVLYIFVQLRIQYCYHKEMHWRISHA